MPAWWTFAAARPDLPGDGPREREVIAAFAEITTEAITATRLENLLALVGQKLCHLLGVSRCSVYLLEDDGRFRGGAGWCGQAGNISAAVQAQEAGIPGDAFSREVIRNAAPVLISDVRNDPRPHRRTMEHWGVRAMLGVPLVFDDEVIGLIFVDNVAQEHVYTDDEVSLAELFGRLAALFIRQALQAARLAAQAEELDRQKRTLEFLADVHATLTGAVLGGADIRAVVGLLSGLAGAPVALLDEDLAVLTWTAPAALRAAPPVLGERARHRPALRAALAELSGGAPEHGARAVVGLRSRPAPRRLRLLVEGRPSGYLAVVEAGRALGDLDTKLAQRGATVLALQVLSERRQIEAEGQARRRLPLRPAEQPPRRRPARPSRPAVRGRPGRRRSSWSGWRSRAGRGTRTRRSPAGTSSPTSPHASGPTSRRRRPCPAPWSCSSDSAPSRASGP